MADDGRIVWGRLRIVWHKVQVRKSTGSGVVEVEKEDWKNQKQAAGRKEQGQNDLGEQLRTRRNALRMRLLAHS